MRTIADATADLLDARSSAARLLITGTVAIATAVLTVGCATTGDSKPPTTQPSITDTEADDAADARATEKHSPLNEASQHSGPADEAPAQEQSPEPAPEPAKTQARTPEEQPATTEPEAPGGKTGPGEPDPAERSARDAPRTDEPEDADDKAGSPEDAETGERIELPEDIVVDTAEQRVEVPAWTCLEEGYLEQVACSPGTREHESLVIVEATPSSLHAALLMAGFEAGRPGEWDYDWETEEFTGIAPEGSKLDVLVKYEDEAGETIKEPIRRWIIDDEHRRPFPDKPFIFAGSRFRENLPHMGPGEHYQADMGGSIVGIVTFGDEMVGYSEVISDRAAVHEPVWMVNPDAIPPLNTEVTLIFAPYDSDRYDGEQGVADESTNGDHEDS